MLKNHTPNFKFRSAIHRKKNNITFNLAVIVLPQFYKYPHAKDLFQHNTVINIIQTMSRHNHSTLIKLSINTGMLITTPV